MILYLSKHIKSGKIFVCDSLVNGQLNYPDLYEFTYLIKVELTEEQIEAIKNKGWTGYDILSNNGKK